MASRSAVKCSTDWANAAPRPITIKFRIRKETSKPQTNYHWCWRFSYLAPYWLISRNTITFHKYFWCWNWKGLPRNGKLSTIGKYRFHELIPQAVSGHANKTRHYQLWDEFIFNRDPRWFKETQLTASIGTVELRILIRGCLQSDTDQYNRTAAAEGTVISSNANNAFDRTLPTISWVRFVRHQSPIARTTVVYEGGVTWENSHRCEFHTGMTFWFRIAFAWWLGHLISRYLKIHFMLIKYTHDSKSQTLRKRYSFQSTGRPIWNRNGWTFCVYMITLPDFVPG